MNKILPISDLEFIKVEFKKNLYNYDSEPCNLILEADSKEFVIQITTAESTYLSYVEGGFVKESVMQPIIFTMYDMMVKSNLNITSGIIETKSGDTIYCVLEFVDKNGNAKYIQCSAGEMFTMCLYAKIPTYILRNTLEDFIPIEKSEEEEEYEDYDG